MKKIKYFLVLLSFFVSINTVIAYEEDAAKAYNEGIDYYQKGQYAEAITAFKSSISIDPTFTDAYYNLGSLYEYIGDEANAIKSFQELLKRNPEDSESAYKLATIHNKLGNYSKALSYLYIIGPDSDKYAEAQALQKKLTAKLNQPKTVEKIVIKDFQGPTGITKDNLGNLFVANFTANTITRITPAGKRIIMARGNQINGPIGLVADKYNNIYVANYGSNEVVKISSTGKITSVLKGVKKPYYLFIDKLGQLYISEQGTNTVIRLKL